MSAKLSAEMPLRLRGGFSLDLFTIRTGLDAAALSSGLQEAAARGLLEVDGDHVRATTLGRRFLNEAIGGFL
jgi:oxygen-independent coproporphyrinogen-3 oxidase